jgi:hypothetical protein
LLDIENSYGKRGERFKESLSYAWAINAGDQDKAGELLL